MTVSIRTDTNEVGWPWALPPVTRVYLTPRARLRRARNRFLASSFARDVRRYRKAASIIGCVAVTYGAIVGLRLLYVVADTYGVAQ